ncbi:MAG: cytochrome b [Brachymonas sp.]|nr:cytochrome b [Brachymonas sp.]
MRDTPKRLSHLTLFLHWTVGLGFLAVLAVGFYMKSTATFALYPLHKSFGVLLFALVMARVVWRVINGFPTEMGQHQPWEHTLARVVHWVLLIGTLLMPLSGMLMSIMGGSGLQLFGLELWPNNPMPEVPGRNLPLNPALTRFARSMHGIVAWAMVVAIALHVAAAFKHHFIDRDGTLSRMLGKRLL